MASCAVGSKASDLIKHSPIELYPTYIHTSPVQKPPEQEHGGEDSSDELLTKPFKQEDKAKLYDDMYAKFLSDWEIEPGQSAVVGYKRVYCLTEIIHIYNMNVCMYTVCMYVCTVCIYVCIMYTVCIYVYMYVFMYVCHV